MPSVYDPPSASEDSDPLQVLSPEECTASSKASTSLKVTVGDPMKAKTSVLSKLVVEQQTNNTVCTQPRSHATAE